MNTERTADIAIVGAGIAGLAHAYMALRKGLKVVLFEREQFSVGASVRNFGLIWPIGQMPGKDFDRALRSRTHWLEVADQAGFWINPNGSLHLAYHEDEWAVLNEFVQLYQSSEYQCELLEGESIQKISSYVNRVNFRGGLWSKTECTVNPREAIRKIPAWLESKFGLHLRFGQAVTDISMPIIKTSRESWRVDKVIICSGADFETLYPEVYDQHLVTRCKLQMMKGVSEKKDIILGPTLCAGLTLRHYAAFSACPSLTRLDQRYDDELMAYKNHGIHVLLAQHGEGELIIGDSHHYGRTLDPFDQEEVNKHILHYLKTFAAVGEITITERWHGIYSKMPGSTHLVVKPEPGVTIVNCLSGAGMTLSFGLAEEIVEQISKE